MNPFSPPPGPYPNNHGPQAGFPFPTNDRPPTGMPFGPNDRPPAGMPFRTNDGPHAGMQYPTYYGSMPGMRGPTTIPPAPAPARKKRMILPVLGGGFVGAVVLAAVIALQGPERYPARRRPTAPQAEVGSGDGHCSRPSTCSRATATTPGSSRPRRAPARRSARSRPSRARRRTPTR